MNRIKMGLVGLVIAALGITAVAAAAQSPKDNADSGSLNTTGVSVTITGGFETDRRDNGRPVVLIASMLGVTPDVFREAFSGVTPSKNGSPSGEQAQANKKALLKVLSPYGITNERLDEVSNYYRYKASLGETWPQTQAAAEAVVVDGKITAITITNPGAAYTSMPKIIIRQGNLTYKGIASILYTEDFTTNGSIASISFSN